MALNELERLARKAHEPWPCDLSYPEVLSLRGLGKTW